MVNRHRIYRVGAVVIGISLMMMVWNYGWQSGWNHAWKTEKYKQMLKPNRILLEEKFEAIQDMFHELLKGSSVVQESNETVADGVNQTQGCGPKQNIVFFKMHKCSSSTIQNILMRYGDTNNLNFVLPKRGNYLGYKPFAPSDMFNFNLDKYNILCHHTRFSFKGMSLVMPRDSVWTTIIRDPVDMYESGFYYRHLESAFHIKSQDPLATFAENPKMYISKYRSDYAKDPMLFDLGLPSEKKDDNNAIKAIIKDLDQYFDLVLVTEYFEESLILLKELMCWGLDDIVYFVVNARATNSVHTISSEVRKRLQDWNIGDVMLYDHFNKSLWRKIEAFGTERMENEVNLLKARNKVLEERCVIDPEKTVNKGGIYHPGGINIKGFVLKPGMENDELCKGMAMPELKYTEYLLQKQKKKYGFT